MKAESDLQSFHRLWLASLAPGLSWYPSYDLEEMEEAPCHVVFERLGIFDFRPLLASRRRLSREDFGEFYQTGCLRRSRLLEKVNLLTPVD